MLKNETSSQDKQHLLSGSKFKTLSLIALISVIGYLLFTLWAGWDNVLAAFIKVGPLGILFALLLSLANLLFRFCRWQYFLYNLGYQVPFKTSLRLYLSGFCLTTTPAKTGEAIRCIFLKDEGVPVRKSFGAFFAERFCDLISVSILATAGLFIYPTIRPILLFVLIVFIFVFLLIQREEWILKMEHFLKRICPLKLQRSVEFVKEMALSFRSCFSTKVLLVAIGIGVFAWVLEAFALYILLQFVGYPIPFITAIFIYGFSLVIGGISMLPGGLGGAEVTMYNLLLFSEVPTAIAVATTLVIRLTSLWFSVLIGLIALPKDKIFFK